jgi:hypothetical protein
MFTDNIYHHSIWRQEVDMRLKNLSQWLEERDLLAPDVRSQLERIQLQNRSDKIMVAFVAEFSRGKSELINAIFFAGYGRRIMPASAGRTTMCPTELGYDARDTICLRLLPIETRLSPQSLVEWRLVPEQWTKVDLNVNDPEQLVAAMSKVAETIEVTEEQARALGFWHDNAADNPIPNDKGLVEVPRWRHARINMDHPLLRQGLIILDTPGLNAIGAEPELTMSLIPQAQAVVFLLATDTGVTASDLTIWKESLAGASDDASRFVVLNKIDTLWDALSTPQQVEKQIEQQRVESARILGLTEDRVMAVSAQKGLQAKVKGDAELLKSSRLDVLEDMLAKRIVERRQDIMLANMEAEAQDVRRQVQRTLGVRAAELSEQLEELKGLQGKSDSVVRHQRMRVAKEQENFEHSVSKTHAIRMVHHKALKQVYALLGNNQLRKEVAVLDSALRDSGFMKVGVKKVYAEAFERLQQLLDDAENKTEEIYELFGDMFKKFNSEYGFTLQIDIPPKLNAYAQELKEVEDGHIRYLGVGNLLKLSQPEFIDRLLRALASRLRIVFERALNEIEQWSRNLAGQIDSQLRERRRGLRRRLASIERAEAAASGLDERIEEIEEALHGVKKELKTFLQQMDHLLEDTTPQQEPPVLLAGLIG